MVTGASSGIGKELAVVLHREGARFDSELNQGIPKRSLYYIDDVRATFLNYFLWYPLLRAVHLRVVMAARRGDVLDQIKEELVVSGGEARAEVNRFNQG